MEASSLDARDSCSGSTSEVFLENRLDMEPCVCVELDSSSASSSCSSSTANWVWPVAASSSLAAGDGSDASS